jgi:hypothetical protein
MKITLTLYSKNWAIFEGFNPLELNAESVPRVGEIIDVGVELGQEITTFIVCDVKWENEDSNLVPVLKCHQWLKGDRQGELEEHGWVHGCS